MSKYHVNSRPVIELNIYSYYAPSHFTSCIPNVKPLLDRQRPISNNKKHFLQYKIITTMSYVEKTSNLTFLLYSFHCVLYPIQRNAIIFAKFHTAVCKFFDMDNLKCLVWYRV